MTSTTDMGDMPPHRDALEAQRRRNIRRTTIVLVLVVLGIYAWFIASSVLKAQ